MYTDIKAITPSDTTDHGLTRALWVDSTGSLKVNTISQTTGVTFKVPAVGLVPLQVTRVYATGSTTTITVYGLY